MRSGDGIQLKVGGQTRTLSAGEMVTIGRDPSADIRSSNGFVSKRHARIVSQGGAWVLEDLNSKRGVFHQGIQVPRLEIAGPMEVWLGPPNQGERLDLAPVSVPVRGKPRTTVPQGPAATLAPSADPAASALRVRIDGKDHVFPPGREIRVGRDPAGDVVSSSGHVSRHHATLRFDGGTWVLEDQSTRGTFHEGRKVSRLPITGPTTVRLADPSTGEQMDLVPGGVRETVQPGVSRIESLIRRVKRSNRRTVGIAAALVVLTVAAAAAFVITRPGQPSLDVERLQAAAVHIEGSAGETDWIGSGTIIGDTGLILTNAHVGDPTAPGLPLLYGSPEEFEQAPDKLVVSLFAGEDRPAKPTYTARVLASDGYLDVAVLQIDGSVEGGSVESEELASLPSVELGDSDQLKNGDSITIIGYPGVGGGWERAIDVAPGAVSGFEGDERIENEARGWIKTTAPIFGGNSGGLAADQSGRIVGIPSRVRFEFEGDDEISGAQGKIRPINLVKPVIDAALAGRQWESPYFVRGTGNESFSLLGWANGQVQDGCEFQAVQGYADGTRLLIPVFRVGGMSPAEDWMYEWLHRPFQQAGNAEGTWTLVHSSEGVWPEEAGQGADCLPLALELKEDIPGEWAVQVRAGPSLKVVGVAEVSVGTGTSTGTEDGAEG